MTADELRRRRAAAQLLTGAPPPRSPGARAAAQLLTGAPPPRSPGARAAAATGAGADAGAAGAVHDAVAHLLAVQAQDPRAMRLALRARGAATSAADVDAAFAARAVVVVWLMRGTLHLVASEDYAWLHALTGELAAKTIRRRLAELGVTDPDREVREVERALADGPLDRPALAARLRAEGQGVPHVLGLAASRGLIVHVGTGFALTRDWLDPATAPDRGAALAELGRRYLRAHGPADAADLAAWSGLGLRAARAALVDAEAGEAGAAPASPPRLLPAFDPYLLGWKDRSFVVDAAHARRVHPGGGMVRATAVVDGRAVGTWTMPRGRVVVEPFGVLAPDVEGALEGEARAVEGFFGSAR
jgi:hypothetical protein